MSNKTRKHIWPVSLVMSLVIVGALAAFVVLATVPGATQAHGGVGDHDAACAAMTDAERREHNAAAFLAGEGLCPTPESTTNGGANGDTTNGDTNGDTTNGALVVDVRLNEDDLREVDLSWGAPVDAAPGTTMYEIQFRIAAGEEGVADPPAWPSLGTTTDKTTFTLTDAMLDDGVVYDVRVRTVVAGAGWTATMQILGPAIYLSEEGDLKARTGDAVNHPLPIPNLIQGTVSYLIEPALPEGLSYEKVPDAGKASVITGTVAHETGGWDRYYRMTVTDKTNDGKEEMDIHYFRITIEEVQVKPLADVIRDRTYFVGETVTHLVDFPAVGDDPDNYTYHIDGLPVGLTFDMAMLKLGGAPTVAALDDDGSPKDYPLKYQARPKLGLAPANIIHEAKFTIRIEHHVCNNGLDYEQTYTTYKATQKVGAANYTIGAASHSYYVLPIGEEGDRGRDKNQTRTFEIRTVTAGGDLTAPDAQTLPPGLQIVQLWVDAGSKNPDNDLFTRQGAHLPARAAMGLGREGSYDDPEPDYPDMDEGRRLAIGVIDPTATLKAERYISCFIVHDTDTDTGERDSSAVVFDLNILAGLNPNDWVIELKAGGETTELDTDEAFTAPAEELTFEAMYIKDDATRARNTNCVADVDVDPNDIVQWEVVDTEVVFTSRSATVVQTTQTQRIQVKAKRESGVGEACVQVRMTVHGPLGEASMVEATAGTGTIALSWAKVANATGYRALAIKLGNSPLTMADVTVMDLGTDDTEYTFAGLTAGDRYLIAVIADQTVGDDTESMLGLPMNPVVTVQ